MTSNNFFKAFMLVEDKIKHIYPILLKMFPDARCELNYNNLYELVVAVMLSAQTTDKAVNLVTPDLFKRYPDLESLSNASVDEVRTYIKSIGLYHNKSVNIINMAKQVITKYNGVIPNNLDELKSLPGIGQKTANVVLVEWFKIPRIPVDTHVNRVAKRLKLAYINDDVTDVERKLKKKIPKEMWIQMHHSMIFFGRYFCKAVSPSCDKCELKGKCRVNYK